MTTAVETASRRHDQLAARWTGHDVGHFTKLEYPRFLPTGLDRQDVGEIRRLRYKRDEDGKLYEHGFKPGDGPHLVESRSTGLWYLAGGAYSVHGGWFKGGRRQPARRALPRYVVRIGKFVAAATGDRIDHVPGTEDYILAVDRYDRAHLIASPSLRGRGLKR